MPASTCSVEPFRQNHRQKARPTLCTVSVLLFGFAAFQRVILAVALADVVQVFLALRDVSGCAALLFFLGVVRLAEGGRRRNEKAGHQHGEGKNESQCAHGVSPIPIVLVVSVDVPQYGDDTMIHCVTTRPSAVLPNWHYGKLNNRTSLSDCVEFPTKLPRPPADLYGGRPRPRRPPRSCSETSGPQRTIVTGSPEYFSSLSACSASAGPAPWASPTNTTWNFRSCSIPGKLP